MTREIKEAILYKKMAFKNGTTEFIMAKKNTQKEDT